MKLWGNGENEDLEKRCPKRLEMKLWGNGENEDLKKRCPGRWKQDCGATEIEVRKNVVRGRKLNLEGRK